MPRLVLRALVCAGLLSSLAAPVLGHAALESATPGPGDRVTGSPMELVAQFSQDLDPTRTSLEVRDATGARVARGGDPGNTPREFRLDLPELAPGKYEVRWTSSSTEDGESTVTLTSANLVDINARVSAARAERIAAEQRWRARLEQAG